MAVADIHKSDIVKAHARGPADTGSPEVQIALLTQRIQQLTEHLKVNQHDQRQVKQCVAQRQLKAR